MSDPKPAPFAVTRVEDYPPEFWEQYYANVETDDEGHIQDLHRRIGEAKEEASRANDRLAAKLKSLGIDPNDI